MCTLGYVTFGRDRKLLKQGQGTNENIRASLKVTVGTKYRSILRAGARRLNEGKSWTVRRRERELEKDER